MAAPGARRGWRVVEIEFDRDTKLRAAVAEAECPEGQCFIVAYSLSEQPRLVIAPAQPSPLCVKGDKLDHEVAYRALTLLGIPGVRFRFPVCRVPRRLLERGLNETVEKLRSLGLLL
ncbi:MAG: hypothetical protein GXO15_03290 [Crenarchaeota archaeon]|nr:hypothetical protein [Thermoproteota archaeon]